MNKKILIADDSLTIQKVINITLANESYELIEAVNEKELFLGLEKSPDLILLDFNLSEQGNGYELIQKINDKYKKSKIFLMLGSFDSIDDSLLKDLGVIDKIVKPFESAKFIQKCRHHLQNIEGTESEDDFSGEFPTTSRDEEGLQSDDNRDTDTGTNRDDDNGQWTIQSSNTQQNDENILDKKEEDKDKIEDNNLLLSELSGWGMEVPAKMDDKSSGISEGKLPPFIVGSDHGPVAREEENKIDDVIENEMKVAELEDTTEQAIPSKDDLTYPTEDFIDEVKKANILNPIDEKSNNETLVLESHNEQDAEDFWSADETEEKHDEKLIELNIEAEKKQEREDQTIDFKSYDQKVKAELATEHVRSVHHDAEIVEQVMEQIHPLLEDLVKKHCEKIIEKVAWEIIPDLAENLIKTEIKEISESVQSGEGA